MHENKLNISFENLFKALDRLGEALAIEPNPIIIDGTIQRFEFTIELFWKTLKRVLQSEGINASSPRDTLKQAFRIGWLDDETIWLSMLDDRNQTSHVYNEQMAERIYQHIQQYYQVLIDASKKLQNIAKL